MDEKQPLVGGIDAGAIATISPTLAANLGIKIGDDIIVSSARAGNKCKANVLPIVGPLIVNIVRELYRYHGIGATRVIQVMLGII